MKKIGMFFVVLALTLGGWFFWLNRDNPTTKTIPLIRKEEVLQTLSPYSIESLSNRDFDEGTIAVERIVRETDQFTSEIVSYISDGLKQYALINTPKKAIPEGGFPVVIVNHGYIPPNEYSTAQSYINTSAYYASQGFLVVKPDYRGHGESEGEADSFFSRINYATDVISLLLSLDSLGSVDTNNIFAYGHSMGGEVTLRVMEATNLIKAASLWAPAVTDFPENQLYFTRRNIEDSDRNQRLVAELKKTINEDEYSQVSTIDNISRINAPLLIHHGTNDESVPYSWGRDLEKRIQAANKSVILYSYSGDNHDISGNFSTALQRDVSFFRKNLTQ